MNRRKFNIGPGAASIILIIVVLSMSVLGVMTLMNARSDIGLSQRSLVVANQIASLNERAEVHLAELDAVIASCAAAEGELYALVEAALPKGMTMDGSIVSWSEEGENLRVLACAVEVLSGEGPRYRWIRHEQFVNSDEMEFDDSWN